MSASEDLEADYARFMKSVQRTRELAEKAQAKLDAEKRERERAEQASDS